MVQDVLKKILSPLVIVFWCQNFRLASKVAFIRIRLKSVFGFKKRYLDSDSPSRVIRRGLSANQMLSV